MNTLFNILLTFSKLQKHLIKIGMILLLLTLQNATAAIRYVKQGGAGNGSSWANASGDLQAMINSSNFGDEIWVAAGTYTPATGQSFSMKEGVKIYGGFPANGNPSIAQRNWNNNITKLEGNGNSVIRNSQNVLTDAAVLDGFTITGGNANEGGGIYINYSTPTLTNLTITGNNADNGGGIYNEYCFSPLKLTNVNITGNSASFGGAIGSTLSTLLLTNVIITGNNANYYGGGLSNFRCSITMNNVCISKNSAGYGGGIYINDSSALTITNVTISGNNGEGILNYGSSHSIYNCIIYGNSSGISGNSGNHQNSLIQGLTDTNNGNINGFVDPMFINPALGDFRLKPCSPLINAGNNSYIPSGVLTDLSGSSRFYNNGIIDIGAYEYQGNPVQTSPPTATAQSHPTGSTVGNLNATGQFLAWYNVESGGSALAANTPLSAQTYYVSQTINGCESTRTAVAVTLTIHPVRYVKEGGAGNGNGTSWANASGDLQAMINADGTEQVWVAAGRYIAPSASFRMKNNVAIYGGFAATGNPTMAQRNWQANPTILDGNYERRVINNDFDMITDLTATAVLDGFTITGGNASGRGGGGIYNIQASPTLRNLNISGNLSGGDGGGGIYNYRSQPILTNVVISRNLAANGGGIYNYSSQPILTNVVISGNRANQNGGGICAAYQSPATLINVTMTGNTAGQNGGAIYNYHDAPQIKNTIIYGNSSTHGSNGVYNPGGGTPNYQNSLVQGITDTANGNISADANPMFTDEANGDYTLKPCSPLINKGNSNSVPNGTDVAGNNRKVGAVDIGAYEFQGTPVLPPTASAQAHLTGATVANLTPNGVGIKWYTAEFGGNALTATTPLAAQTYYVSRTVDGCETTRTAVAVTINYPMKYVKAGGTGNGSSWANASGDIQAMIDAPATEQVWVAAGTYTPAASIRMKNGVAIYGGFPAANNPTMAERNWQANPTILSGNNERRVINNAFGSSNGLNDTAVLDGFTITGGNATGGDGGGIYNYVASPTLRNLIISGNISGGGGGIYNAYSSATLTNVVISGNTGSTGGGMYNSTGGAPVLTNVTISGNRALASGSPGGAIRNNGNGSGTVLRNSIIYGNNSGVYGAGYTYFNSLVQGITSTSDGNINGNANPKFVNGPSHTTAPFTGGDYKLMPCSPVINAGSDAHIPTGTTLDLAGSTRKYGTVDMGAYEYQGNPILPPTATATQSYPTGSTVANLTPNGADIKWYDAEFGGTALATNKALATLTYYVSQTVGGCETTRTAVTVTITYPIKYVKVGGSGTGSGTSWANASSDIQAMIDAANTEQVWVAAGTYTPAASIRMKNGVAIYGGFATTGNPTMAQRNWNTNVTTLSGNNERRVINNEFGSSNGLTATAVLDGFTITGGKTAESGGGINNYVASPTLRNLIISGNTSGGGGGIHNAYSSATLTNVVISGNTGYTGGGMYNSNGALPVLTNVTISGNRAPASGSPGGAIRNNGPGSGTVLRNSIIYGNNSGVYGGGYTYFNSLVQGITDTADGNINGDANPKFVNAPSHTTAPFTGGDYKLMPCSPVINAGSDAYVTTGITLDLAGSTRKYGTVDMGAYEHQGNPVLPPTAAATQSYPTGATVANLTPNGAGIKWYDAEFGGNALTATTPLTAQTHYVSQTVGGCETTRTAVTVTITYPIKYVRVGGSGTGNGTNWANASSDIQAMINADDTEQVWVAAGTYTPAASIRMKNGVAIYGGFPATNNPTMAQRNWQANPTILGGNNVRTVINNSFNSSNMLTGTAVLDGFTVTGGKGNFGGGCIIIFLPQPSPILSSAAIFRTDPAGGCTIILLPQS